MASLVDIANRALTKIGAARIMSIDDDSTAARAVKSMIDVIRQAELRAHVWSFAKRRAAIPALADAPAFGYLYAYQLPDGCLRVLEVDGGGQGVDLSNYRGVGDPEYTIEGRKILINSSAPLKLIYIYDETNPIQYDALFVEVFACRLAAELCEPVTQSNTKREMAWQEYKRAIRDAIAANAIELPSQPQADDSWIMGRL